VSFFFLKPNGLPWVASHFGWQLDLAEAIDFTIWLRGRFEPATLALCERLVSPGAVVLDIGANVAPHANASTRPRDGKFNRAHYSSSVLWLRPR